ncbi:uncharacterized protein J3D65DRAFT_16349 [Phyllosticta citribraziliensis]|uniref:Secreted protein n=1 Tax=Phyllosticta citribraziliensis TaxID=989973 RepID=A0ABR1M8Z3_9PEZI
MLGAIFFAQVEAFPISLAAWEEAITGRCAGMSEAEAARNPTQVPCHNGRLCFVDNGHATTLDSMREWSESATSPDFETCLWMLCGWQIK